MRFRDRSDAGRRLSLRLLRFRPERPVVLGIPRGGVPVAFEVASALGAPLDVVIVRKLPAPGHPDLAIGAIAEDGRSAINFHLAERLRLRAGELAAITQREGAELRRLVALYRRGHPALPLHGRTVIIVDDGLSTGATARAAVEVAKHRGAVKIVVAAPVSSRDVLSQLREVCAGVVTVETPPFFAAREDWYRDAEPPEDAAVIELVERASTGAFERIPMEA
jgi:putative phosphoribosyl transferase